MPKYRIKSGTLHLKNINGKSGRTRVPANSIVNLSVETATKFRDQLLPMDKDAAFLDSLDEYSDMINRETHLRIVPIDGQTGFFNVHNTVTRSFLNTAPLTHNQAMELMKGANMNIVYDEEKLKGKDRGIVDQNRFVEEEVTTSDNDDNNDDEKGEAEISIEELNKLKRSEIKQFIKDRGLDISTKNVKTKVLKKVVIEELDLSK